MTTETASTPATKIPQKPGKRFIIEPDGKQKRYVTLEEYRQAANVVVSDKIYKRKGNRKERHRIVLVQPQFTAPSGLDKQTIEVDGEHIDVIFAIPRVLVEKFEWIERKSFNERKEEVIAKSILPLSSWMTDALDFAAEYERFPDED